MLMTTDPKSLLYPALCIPKSMGVFCVQSARGFERCQAVLFWKARLYEGLKVIDKSGTKFEVVKATVSKPSSHALQWIVRFLDLPIRTHLELEKRGTASLSEVVEAVNSSIEEDPEAFEEFSGKTIEWWREILATCNSSKDVVMALDQTNHG